jgi:hypothetical protein
MEENYLYYQLWRQVPEDFWERLIGTNRPKTRDKIVKAIEQLKTDRKRDRLKSTTAIQSENKRFKPEDKQHYANRDKKQEGNNTKHKGIDNAGPPPDKSKEKYCGYCKMNTHMEKICFCKNAKGKEKEDSSNSRPNCHRAQLAAVDNSGKEKAPAIPPNHWRKDQWLLCSLKRRWASKLRTASTYPQLWSLTRAEEPTWSTNVMPSLWDGQRTQAYPHRRILVGVMAYIYGAYNV